MQLIVETTSSTAFENFLRATYCPEDSFSSPHCFNAAFCFLFSFFLGSSWRKFPKIPRRKRFSSLNDRIFKLFHLSKAEIKRAKEMEKKLQPKSEHFHR